MNRLSCITLCTLISLGFLLSPAASESDTGRQWGLGIEAQSFGFNLAQTGSDEFFGIKTTATTPYFLFSLRWSPKFFVEPGVGITLNKSAVDYTPEGGRTLTDETSFSDINFGIACRYVTKPGDFTSPFVHLGLNLHFLGGKTIDQYWDYMSNGIETVEAEISATAFSLAGGLGGMLSIGERVFLSVEGRLLFAYMGDIKKTLTGPGTELFKDDTDTKSWTFDSNMVAGFRILM